MGHTLTEPTRSTREFLRAHAGTNAKLRRLLKGLSRKERREAVERAQERHALALEQAAEAIEAALFPSVQEEKL